VGRRNEYQPKSGDACGWGVKAGIVRVWVAGKTVCYTRAITAIYERFRDEELIYSAI